MMPQIAQVANIMPGVELDGGYGDVDFREERRDHRALLLSQEFQNLVLQKLWIQTDILQRYDGFEGDLLALIEVLERELG